MGENEAGTLDALRAHCEERIKPKISKHEDHVMKQMAVEMVVQSPLCYCNRRPGAIIWDTSVESGRRAAPEDADGCKTW